MAALADDASFPCSISLQVPFPTDRLASTALRAIEVDPELSPLVRRHLALAPADPRVLRVDYRAATNRMLRVAVNSFMDSLGLVVEVMEQLDEDVLANPPAEAEAQ
ncbi:Transcription factor Pcc1 [Cordyceps fumosorosea ARSEF 2679]|uniref:Transcription factor Pcc1 n=1 Tax=Cordyceps fumosorosea (strain ARSEF 2679) TaxID=1081104 RepID=A0A162JSU7_CORFA|nr:Transcription factor Pcc1 [Cordyceps fumosorosea ARSEF 2679]OAA73252.1 Transcription factor Pcc1 [Cordyceps fumosorosea ARSEF 2679]